MIIHVTSKDFEAIIIGGGQAGLATAYYLLRAGVDTLVLDDQEDAGGAWRHVWPSMTLFSTAEFSSLPGKPMPAYEGFHRRTMSSTTLPTMSSATGSPSSAPCTWTASSGWLEATASTPVVGRGRLPMSEPPPVPGLIPSVRPTLACLPARSCHRSSIRG